MKHLFILNPVAGKGKTMKLIPEIKELMEKHSFEFKIEITKAPGHATEIAREYSNKYPDLRIYAVGGDGTMNEVLQGMVGSGSYLGVVPAGTGNDFLKSFCSVMNPSRLLPVLIQAEAIPVDLCKINDRYFLNIASAGFDADVVANTQYLKKLPFMQGKIAYIGGILLSLIRLKNVSATFSIDDEKIEMPGMLLSAFANGRFYGGGMLPAPEAVPDDGYLDVCLIKDMNRLGILRFFPRFIKGTHINMSEVTTRRCRTVRMESPEPVHVNADGELFEANKLDITLIHKGLMFIKP
ncbi:MAG: diacylglycerol kinase family lipid kinase [Clostridiaceae bacterium]|jgi:diacylglycerol kinase (ATP)|nr:diacylglycerol kinase family lipid kinase [Clostridiaceae bacterium]